MIKDKKAKVKIQEDFDFQINKPIFMEINKKIKNVKVILPFFKNETIVSESSEIINNTELKQADKKINKKKNMNFDKKIEIMEKKQNQSKIKKNNKILAKIEKNVEKLNKDKDEEILLDQNLEFVEINEFSEEEEKLNKLE